MRLIWVVLAGLVTLATTSRGDTSPPSLHYTVDAAFSYIDRYGRPATNMVQTDAVEPADQDDRNQYRSIGLTRLRLGLDWIAFQGADFHAVLRPDALNRTPGSDGEVREFDTRAGSVYRTTSPLVKPLDAYHFRLAAGNSFAARFGVFEALAPDVGAYPVALEFGLRVRMPAKYSGLEVGWRSRPDTTEGVAFDLIAYQGDEDRVEDFEAKEDSYDTGPQAEDPFYGGALRLRWTPTKPMTLGLIGGSSDQKVADGKRTESLFRLFSEVWLDYLPWTPKVVLEFRYVTEKWRLDTTDIAEKVQQNVSLTSSWQVGAKTWFLLGGHMGRSDREKPGELNKILPADGHQIDLGLLGRFDRQLTWHFLMNEERREIESSDGDKQGGFLNSSGDRRTLRRMALGLRYLLDANG